MLLIFNYMAGEEILLFFSWVRYLSGLWTLNKAIYDIKN